MTPKIIPAFLRSSLKTCKILAIVAGLSAAAFCQEMPTPVADVTSAITAVKNEELNLAKLLVKGDWDAYAAHLSDEYVRTGSAGEVENKSEVLAAYRAGKNTPLDVIPEELDVRIFGETAILTGHISTLVRQNGRVTTAFTRITEIFVRQNRQWLVAGTQYTRVLK